MDIGSAVLLVSIFLVGWVASGFVLLGPEIIRQVQAKRRMERWRRLTSENRGMDSTEGSDESSKRHQRGTPR
jgi:hypothetical protein